MLLPDNYYRELPGSRHRRLQISAATPSSVLIENLRPSRSTKRQGRREVGRLYTNSAVKTISEAFTVQFRACQTAFTAAK